MDNASYHSRLADSAVGPTMSWKKDDIITYMIDNKIVPPQLLDGYKTPAQAQEELTAMLRGDRAYTYVQPVYKDGDPLPSREQYKSLYKADLLIRVPKKPKVYVTDELCKSYGVEMVRLPPYHCEFNPIELVWAWCKNGVRTRNVEYKLEAAMRIMEAECKAVDAERWAKAEQHAFKEEDIAMKGDMLVLHAINHRSESCVLTFSDSSDGEGDSDSDSDDLVSVDEIQSESGDGNDASDNEDE